MPPIFSKPPPPPLFESSNVCDVIEMLIFRGDLYVFNLFENLLEQKMETVSPLDAQRFIHLSAFAATYDRNDDNLGIFDKMIAFFPDAASSLDREIPIPFYFHFRFGPNWVAVLDELDAFDISAPVEALGESLACVALRYGLYDRWLVLKDKYYPRANYSEFLGENSDRVQDEGLFSEAILKHVEKRLKSAAEKDSEDNAWSKSEFNSALEDWIGFVRASRVIRVNKQNPLSMIEDVVDSVANIPLPLYLFLMLSYGYQRQESGGRIAKLCRRKTWENLIRTPTGPSYNLMHYYLRCGLDLDVLFALLHKISQLPFIMQLLLQKAPTGMSAFDLLINHVECQLKGARDGQQFDSILYKMLRLLKGCDFTKFISSKQLIPIPPIVVFADRINHDDLTEAAKYFLYLFYGIEAKAPEDYHLCWHMGAPTKTDEIKGNILSMVAGYDTEKTKAWYTRLPQPVLNFLCHEKDSLGDLPIHIAAKWGRKDIFSFLIEKHPDLLYSDILQKGISKTPLELLTFYKRDPALIGWAMDKEVEIGKAAVLHYPPDWDETCSELMFKGSSQRVYSDRIKEQLREGFRQGDRAVKTESVSRVNASLFRLDQCIVVTDNEKKASKFSVSFRGTDITADVKKLFAPPDKKRGEVTGEILDVGGPAAPKEAKQTPATGGRFNP